MSIVFTFSRGGSGVSGSTPVLLSSKIPGKVPEDGGIGNEDFNAGRKKSKYGYEILKLWMLKQPINLEKAKLEGFLKGPPQKYCWAPLDLLRRYPLDEQVQLIAHTSELSAEEGLEEEGILENKLKQNNSTSC